MGLLVVMTGCERTDQCTGTIADALHSTVCFGGSTFSRPKRRSLSGNDEDRDFSNFELLVPIMESPNRLKASYSVRHV